MDSGRAEFAWICAGRTPWASTGLDVDADKLQGDFNYFDEPDNFVFDSADFSV